MKLRVSVSRKLTDHNYGSRGASCDLEGELDSSLIDRPDELREKIRRAYTICAEAVADELDREESISTGRPAGDPEPPSPRRPERPAPPPGRQGGGGGGDRRNGSDRSGGNGGGQSGPPRTGKQLMGWMKKQSDGDDLFERAVDIAKSNGYGWKLADLDPEQAEFIYHELVTKRPTNAARWGG